MLKHAPGNAGACFAIGGVAIRFQEIRVVKLNLFSISYAGLWGQDSLPLDDFIGKAASLGYDGVMLAGKRPHHCGVKGIENLDRCAARFLSWMAEHEIAGVK